MGFDHWSTRWEKVAIQKIPEKTKYLYYKKRILDSRSVHCAVSIIPTGEVVSLSLLHDL